MHIGSVAEYRPRVFDGCTVKRQIDSTEDFDFFSGGGGGGTRGVTPWAFLASFAYLPPKEPLF